MRGRAGLLEEGPGLRGLGHWKRKEQGWWLTRALPQQEAVMEGGWVVRGREKSWLASQGDNHCEDRCHWKLDSMPSGAGPVGKIHRCAWWLVVAGLEGTGDC